MPATAARRNAATRGGARAALLRKPAQRESAPPGAAQRASAPPGAAQRASAPPGAGQRVSAPPGAAQRASAPPRAARAEYLESLDRGLRVLELFGGGLRHEYTMIEVAETLGMARAAALRVLVTLEHLGYLHSSGRAFALTPRVLGLGYAYLSRLGFRAVARPIADALMQDTGETCSIGVLDRGEVVYVLRCEARRIIRIDLTAGSRIPAYLNSMGRVLLAALPERELRRYLAALKPVAVTRRTVVKKSDLRQVIAGVRAAGWCYIEGEVEQGVAGIAAPIRDRDGVTVAALNLSLVHSRYSQRHIKSALLPRLLDGVCRIEAIIHNDVVVA